MRGPQLDPSLPRLAKKLNTNKHKMELDPRRFTVSFFVSSKALHRNQRDKGSGADSSISSSSAPSSWPIERYAPFLLTGALLRLAAFSKENVFLTSSRSGLSSSAVLQMASNSASTIALFPRCTPDPERSDETESDRIRCSVDETDGRRRGTSIVSAGGVEENEVWWSQTRPLTSIANTDRPMNIAGKMPLNTLDNMGERSVAAARSDGASGGGLLGSEAGREVDTIPPRLAHMSYTSAPCVDSGHSVGRWSRKKELVHSDDKTFF